MNFEELDHVTRGHMLAEFEAEQAGPNPFRSRGLSAYGLQAFPELMREAIRSGNEETLTAALNVRSYWNPTETYVKNGVSRQRQVNIQQTSERLGLTEFNTWYVRGLARRLWHERVAECQIYRAGVPKWEPAECSSHEGQICPVQLIYDGHRARYWPEPGNLGIFSIPFGPGCHHSIRRVPKK